MTDYFDIYEIAERYFSLKRNQLVRLLRDDFQMHFAGNPSSLDIVDIGSGDGRLFRDFLSELPEDLKEKLSITCLEPDDSNFQGLSDTFNATNNVQLLKADMGAYIADGHHFDAAFLTHMLYHIPQEEWADALSPVIDALKPRGAAYITLVEDGTDVYNLGDAHIKRESKDGKTIGGDYIFAHHLNETFSRMDMRGKSLARLPNKGLLNIAESEIEQFIQIAKTGDAIALSALDFVQFLGFVLRQESDEIAGNSNLIQAMARHLSERKQISTTDTVYKITNANDPSCG